MDDWQRAIDFMRWLDGQTAEEIVPYSRGRALVNRRFRLVHDANYLVADQLDGATAAELIKQAERIQAGLSLRHRRVNVDDQAAAARLATGFASAGYLPEAFLIMVRKGAPDRVRPSAEVSVLDWQQLRPARRQLRVVQRWAYRELVDQIIARQELTASLIATRYLGVVVEGQVVSSCEVRLREDVAQIETVETVEPYRKRGYAGALVAAALEAVRDKDFVFLVTDLHDWPQHFYRRLGFQPVGIESRFLRIVDG
jgi:ribosomal protein S18 acetylase RimI-like enzyme